MSTKEGGAGGSKSSKYVNVVYGCPLTSSFVLSMTPFSPPKMCNVVIYTEKTQLWSYSANLNEIRANLNGFIEPIYALFCPDSKLENKFLKEILFFG